MKVLLDYDETTNEVKDANNYCVGFCPSLKPFDCEESKKANVDDIVKLKEAGFEAQDIIELKRKGVI